MKKNSLVLILIIYIACGFCSCKKDDYKVDGGVSDAHVNMTTYDYLKSKPIFSSLVTLIDRAGLKDAINGDVTFFATTNYGVDEYLKAMKNIRAIQLGDENITFTLDSIPLFRIDSLKTYIFPGKITRDEMTTKGTLYNTSYGEIPNVKYMIRLIRTYDYSAYVDYVDYVQYSRVVGTRDDLEIDPTTIPEDQKDQSTFCQTTGIITTTGIVHVLDGYHRLFFNTDPIN